MSEQKKSPPAAASAMAAGQDDDEQDILASMNASLQDHSAYETTVLREATLKLAPQLQADQLGFPTDCSSSLGTTDLTVLHSVLTETRRKIQQAAAETSSLSSAAPDLLYMKEQILLHQISTIAGTEELPVRPREERSAEQTRSRRLVEGRKGMADTIAPARKLKAPPKSTNNGESSHAQPQQRQRVPMMKRKRMESEEQSAVAETQESNPLTEEELAKLKEMREERRQRREQRKKYYESPSSSSEEEEFENDGAAETASVGGGDDDASDKEEESMDNQNTVTCPLCQERVDVVNGSSDVDAILSQHMALCQNQRRSSRRTTRNSSAEAKPSAKRKGSMVKQKSKGHKNKKNDNPKQAATTRSTAVAVDDIDELDYEDRVDDWIETGLSRMKAMKERDDSEAPPGAEEYEGGLLVPEWMNNRLFSYQREGLKWMWELHQQLVGGVVRTQTLLWF